MKKILVLILVMIMLCNLAPISAFSASEVEEEPYKGKVVSILGDSISTFEGYIPVADGFNMEHLPRYPQSNLLMDVEETWWMQVIRALDAKLGINDSWRGATVSGDAPVTTGTTGENAAMANLTRIQNLGSNGTPDVILFYGGTNDLAHVSKIGSFDKNTAPSEVDLITKKWDNLADGYVNTLLRLRYYYPDATIIAMLPTYTSSYYINDKLSSANAVLADICDYYGVAYVDLRYSGITTADLPDGVHPNANGMDYISDMVLEALYNINVTPGENVVHSVIHNLVGAKSSLGYYKGVSHGESFVATISGDRLSVSVTMGGVNITETAYVNGVVTIPEVTGDIVITAEGAVKPIYEDYIQPLPENICPATNLWNLLGHDVQYYTVSGWGKHTSDKVYSVTVPISGGDRIFATSFGKAGNNGGSVNGIRLTWFDESGVIKSMSPDETYNEFTKNGYLTAPKNAHAVNVVVWDVSKVNEFYILSLDHIYEQGTCIACGDYVGPAITNQPESVEAAIGEKFSISVEAVGEGLTYQWYYKDSNMAEFEISSNTTASYSYTMEEYRHNRQVYCIITDIYGNTVKTETAAITRSPVKLHIIEEPRDVEAAIGEKFSISVEAAGEGLTYQWYYKDSNMAEFEISSNTTASYSYTMEEYRHNRQVYCIITDLYGNTVKTETAAITRSPVKLHIIEEPRDVEAAIGEKFSISVEAVGESLTYQWYYKDSNMAEFEISSNTTASYSYTMQDYRHNRRVYCVVTDVYGNTVQTKIATMTCSDHN